MEGGGLVPRGKGCLGTDLRQELPAALRSAGALGRLCLDACKGGSGSHLNLRLRGQIHHLHTNAHTHTRMHMHTHVHTHVRVHTYTHARVHTYTHIHARLHRCTHTCTMHMGTYLQCWAHSRGGSAEASSSPSFALRPLALQGAGRDTARPPLGAPGPPAPSMSSPYPRLHCKFVGLTRSNKTAISRCYSDLHLALSLQPKNTDF